MKILHCSDIHLGRRPAGGLGEFSNKRYNDYFIAFEKVIDKALEDSIDIMLVSGDLFDRRELYPEVLEKTEKLMDKLKAKNIKLILVEGNHDNISIGKENESWIKYLENKQYLERPGYIWNEEGYTFNTIKIGEFNFYGIGYPGGFVNEILKSFSEYLKKSKSKNNILLVHTAISSPDFLPGSVDKEIIDLLKDKVLYIAGGHAHSHNVYPVKDPFFFVPGSLEYWDLKETEGKKGFIIYDTDTLKYKFYQSNPRRKININIKTKINNFNDFKEVFIENIDKYNIIANEDIVYIDIKLETSFFIDLAWCEQILTEKGALKTVVRVRYPESKKDDFDHQVLSIEETEKEIINDWISFSANSEKTVKSLQKLKEYQMEDNYDLYLDEFDKFLDILIDQGIKS